METTIDMWVLLGHYCINLAAAFIFIILIYHRFRTGAVNLVFTFFMFNTIVFFVSFILSTVTLSVGFAFGLFAIFGILRYRTEPIPIREMTYLFGTITIGLLNGLAENRLDPQVVMVPNLAIIMLAFILEFFLSRRTLSEKEVIYEKIDNIKPENHTRLKADLVSRTGLDIVSFEITRVDFLRDVARIRIFYRDHPV